MSIGIYYVDARHPRLMAGGGVHDCCYQSSKLDGDNVGEALKDCHDKAVDELGNKDIQLIEWFWYPNWIGTIWRGN